MKFDRVSAKEYQVTCWDVPTYSHIYDLYVKVFPSVTLQDTFSDFAYAVLFTLICIS